MLNTYKIYDRDGTNGSVVTQNKQPCSLSRSHISIVGSYGIKIKITEALIKNTSNNEDSINGVGGDHKRVQWYRFVLQKDIDPRAMGKRRAEEAATELRTILCCSPELLKRKSSVKGAKYRDDKW